jgi:hypothetical protein
MTPGRRDAMRRSSQSQPLSGCALTYGPCEKWRRTQSCANPSPPLTGENAGNRASPGDLLASRRREFSCCFAPFPAIPNRELSGIKLPISNPCFPLSGSHLQGVKAEGVHFRMQRTWRLLRRMSLPLNKIAPRAGPGHAGKPAAAQGMAGADQADRSPTLGVCR